MRAWALLAVLSALMVVDFVDRQVVVSMFPHLATEWSLSDGQLGALVSVVSVAIAAGAIPLAYLADRCGRVATIAAMALAWSAATIACAFATTYAELVVARGVVGLGEAAYGAAGTALLASLFPAERRNTVLGVFLAGALLGSVLGVALGGLVAERYGWRAGFVVAGAPGIALAILFVAIARGERSLARPAAPATRSLLVALRAVVGPSAMMIVCVGGALQLVVVASIFAWLPSFLHREHGLSPADAGVRAGLVILVAGLGTIAWSVVADRWSARRAGGELRVAVVASLVSAALFATAFGAMAPGPAQLVAIIAGAAAMTGTVGPVATAVMAIVPETLRATAAALLALVTNLVGLASGPLLAGWLSDRYGLTVALATLPAFGVAAAALFVLAAPRFAADRARIGDNAGSIQELESA
jgi:MFS family permease